MSGEARTRTTVYVAMHGLVKARDGINYRQERVTLASDPAVARYPDAWRELGTVDAAGAAYIEMLGDAAVLPRVSDRIVPLGAVTPSPGAPAGDVRRVEILRLEAEAAEREDLDAIARNPNGALAAMVLGLRPGAFLRPPTREAEPDLTLAQRKPGRQPWKRSLFVARYEEARRNTPEPWTDEALARNFRGLSADGAVGVTPEYLAKLRRRAAAGQLPD